MNILPSEKENPNGLHLKYIITKANGEPVDENAEYFVLRLDDKCSNPHHAEASKRAIIQYAISIREYMPELATEILMKYNFL